MATRTEPEIGAEQPERENGGNGGRGHRERAQQYFRANPRAKRILIGAVLLVLIGAAFAWWYYSTRESTDDAQIEGHIVPVAARVGGTVKEVRVDDNQYVKEGDILAVIDPRDYQIAVDRAKADLADAQASSQAAATGVPITHTTTASAVEAARAQVDNARAAIAAADQQVDAAQARLREAEARWKLAQADLERMKQLVEKDEISRQRYDTAVTTEQAARATYDAAQAAVATARQQAVQARGGLQQAQAQLASAGTAPQQVQVSRARESGAAASVDKSRAALAQVELNLAYTVVRAPFSGIVSKKSVEVGQIVQPGQPMFAIVNLDDIWVVANFKETQLKNMRPGQPVSVHIDAYGKDYNGHVDSIGGATGAKFSLLPPENATGNFVKVVQRIPVKIVFEKGQDPQHLLRPGMSVVPTVKTK